LLYFLGELQRVPFLPDLATDVLELVGTSCLEKWIHIDVLALGVANLLKTVHVELANE
jgi:hypothetical protein